MFLVATAILIVAIRESSAAARNRSRYLGYLIVSPLVLTVQAMGLGSVSWIFMLVILLAVDRFIRRWDRPTAPRTFRLWLKFWLIEAALPISVHFAFRTRGDLERVALLVAGVVLLLGALLTFLVIAPDLREPLE